MDDLKAPDWKSFGKAIMEEWQEHGDIDAAEKFDLAVKFNILRKIPGGFDPEEHTDCYGGAEAGDDWYEMNPSPDLAAEVLRLRRALEVFADTKSYLTNGPCDPDSPKFSALKIARAALKGGSNG